MSILFLGIVSLSHCYQFRAITFDLENSGTDPSTTNTDFTTNTDLYEDVDKDDNGLMEIYFWEDLDKVRYVLDGSGRKESAAGALITKGETGADTAPRCKTGKLCGYELMNDLDFCEPTHFRDGSGVACVSVSEDPRNTPGDTSDDVSVQKPNSNHPFYNGGKGWEPIGTTEADASFRAVFEGNGRAITNLYVSERQYSGLFAVASGAEFHNLNLMALYISSSSSSSFSGGLVGNVSGGDISITKIYVSGHVFASSSSSAASASYSGGLVGYMNGNNTSITDSYVSATVSSSSASSSASYSGGLVGYVDGGDTSIINSYMSGTASSFSSSSSSYSYSGGLVGYVSDGDIDIINGYMRGTVSSSSSSFSYSGGLVGYVSDGDIGIINSYMRGTVSSSASSSFSYSGGLVAYVGGGDTSIMKSYVSATVSSSSAGGLISRTGTGTLTIEKAYYLAPTSGALQAVGDDNSFTTTEHQRIETQLQGTSLQTELGSAFYFKADEYPFLRKLLPGGDGFFGSSDDTYSENNDLLGGQQ